MSDHERMFPVLWQGNRQEMAELTALDCPRVVPWSLVAPHEAQAKTNHDQDLETLARRGGLCPQELAAVLAGRRLRRPIPPLPEAVAAVKRAMDEHSGIVCLRPAGQCPHGSARTCHAEHGGCLLGPEHAPGEGVREVPPGYWVEKGWGWEWGTDDQPGKRLGLEMSELEAIAACRGHRAAIEFGARNGREVAVAVAITDHGDWAVLGNASTDSAEARRAALEDIDPAPGDTVYVGRVTLRLPVVPSAPLQGPRARPSIGDRVRVTVAYIHGPPVGTVGVLEEVDDQDPSGVRYRLDAGWAVDVVKAGDDAD